MSLAAEAVRQGVEPCFASARQDWPSLLSAGVPPDHLIEPEPELITSRAGGRGVVLIDTLWSGNGERTGREVEVLVAAGLTVCVVDSLPPDQYEAPLDGSGAHLVVTPYLGADRLRRPPRARRWLAGPEYCVLDPAFTSARARVKCDGPRRMLFACGGSDPEGTTAEFLERLPADTLGIDVVVGPLFSEELRARLEKAAAGLPAVVLHRAPANLAGLIADAGVVAGRAGLQRYEAAALGRSGVYIHYGDSFRNYMQGFAESGIARIHFAAAPGGLESFFDHVVRIAGWDGEGTPPSELAFNEAAFAAVDGDGARRLLQVIRTASGG